MAVCGDDPRHRRQPRLRLHHPGQGRRPRPGYPARPRTGPLRADPARTRRLPAGPAPRAGPGSPDPREPIAVLADILDRDGAELSATEIRQRNLANADHLAILDAIWAAETRPARHDRYRELVMAALPPGLPARALPPGQVAVPDAARRRNSPAWTPPRSPARRSSPGTWPTPATSPRHRRPHPPARRPAGPPARKAPGPTASPSCPMPSAGRTWPRSPR